jgi:hypothetical protein
MHKNKSTREKPREVGEDIGIENTFLNRTLIAQEIRATTDKRSSLKLKKPSAQQRILLPDSRDNLQNVTKYLPDSHENIQNT